MVSGSRIKYYRREKNITQEQLAEASELSSNYISQIENNKKQVSMTALQRIADVLKIPISEFLLETDNPPAMPDKSIVMDELSDCTDQEIVIICDMVRQLKRSLRASH